MPIDRHIRVISFDLDNTLWDIDSVMHRATEVQHQWLCEYRPKVVDLLTAREMFGFKMEFLRNNPHLRHQISELRVQALKFAQLTAGYSEQEAESGAREAFEVVLQARHDVSYYENALDVLAELAKTHTLVAVSNGNADVYRLEVGQYFHSAIRAEQYDASKPDPKLFHAALASAGVPAHESVHVGDNPVDDIHGANAVGMHSVWFNPDRDNWPGGSPPSEEIAKLAELPRAIEKIEATARARSSAAP